MTIKELFKHIESRDIDDNFRKSSSFSEEERNAYIVSILNGESTDLLLINYDSTEGQYTIVDGQKRANCLVQFYCNEFSLDESENNFFCDLPSKQRMEFLNYDLDCRIVKDYDENRMHDIINAYAA